MGRLWFRARSVLPGQNNGQHAACDTGIGQIQRGVAARAVEVGPMQGFQPVLAGIARITWLLSQEPIMMTTDSTVSAARLSN